MIASNYQNWHIFHAKKPTERLLESRVRVIGASTVRRGEVGVLGQLRPGLLPDSG